MKQTIDLLDLESGFKLSLESASQVLTKDITVTIPDGDNVTLATTKELEDLRSKLTDGTITVRNASTLDNKQASAFALSDLSNVDLNGLNIGSGEIVKFGSFGSTMTTIPAVNNFIDFLSISDTVNSITGIIDNTKFLLKANHVYNIRGSIPSFEATSGNIQLTYKLYSVSTGLEVITSGTGLFMYSVPTGTSGIRNWEADGFVSPTEDVYLRLKIISNTLVSGNGLSTRTTITEYTSKDISLANFSINGKIFDVNNNVDLEGLSTLSGYNTTETLTERRWIDGKPIYRKVVSYTVGAVAPSTDITITTGIADGELGWIAEYKQVDITNVSTESNSYYISNTAENRVVCTKNGSSVTILISNNSASLINNVFYITLEYTKATDTSSSPVRLVGSGNGTAGIVSELPALLDSEGKLLRVKNGLLEWFDDGFVGCSVNSDSSTTITAGQVGKIKFTSEANCKVYDTHNAYDYVNNKFIAPLSGYYEVIGKTGYNTGGYNRTHIYKNGTIYRIGSDSSGNHSMVTDIIYLNAGDSIELYGFSSVANTTYVSSLTYLTISLKK